MLRPRRGPSVQSYIRLSAFQRFLAATKQLYEWFSPFVCPSVRPSVRHTFLTMFSSSYNHEIFRSYYQWQKWCPCKRSRSEVKGQGHRGHDPIQPFPDRNSSLNSHIAMKWCIQLDVAWERGPIVFQGHPSIFKVTRLKKSSNLTQIGRFRTVTPVWIHQWLRNGAQSLE